jgi:GTP-dependent phosphoenolpyruvate carboxykinase
MGNFPEAKALHLEYERVHERITSLSKSLGLQLEAMQIAVHGVDVTFDNLEEDLRYRFHEIRAEVNQERDEMLNEQIKRENNADHTDAGY